MRKSLKTFQRDGVHEQEREQIFFLFFIAFYPVQVLTTQEIEKLYNTL